jgi:very-short-patch-repair endonuclease
MTNLMSERTRRMRRDKEPAERKLWYLLREFNRRGFRFRQQAPIGPYIADFCDHTARLIIEVDGSHHDELRNRASDQRRTAWLNSRGYRVLRFWNHEVQTSLGGVEIEIKVALGLLEEGGVETRPSFFMPSPMERLQKKAHQLARLRRPRRARAPRCSGQDARHNVPSPLAGEGQGGGDCRTSEVGGPPTPSPSLQWGGESGRRSGRGTETHNG